MKHKKWKRKREGICKKVSASDVLSLLVLSCWDRLAWHIYICYRLSRIHYYSFISWFENFFSVLSARTGLQYCTSSPFFSLVHPGALELEKSSLTCQPARPVGKLTFHLPTRNVFIWAGCETQVRPGPLQISSLVTFFEIISFHLISKSDTLINSTHTVIMYAAIHGNSGVMMKQQFFKISLNFL